MLDDIAREGAARGCRWSTPKSARCCACSRAAIGATRILEIGTAIGYSGIWLAGALPPDGMLFTMERDPERAREARENFARAGLADRVSVMVGDAQLLIAKVAGPFDLIFQDGDKKLYGADARIGWSICSTPAACSSPTTCCGTAKWCPGSCRRPTAARTTRARLPITMSASTPIRC